MAGTVLRRMTRSGTPSLHATAADQSLHAAIVGIGIPFNHTTNTKDCMQLLDVLMSAKHLVGILPTPGIT